MTYYLENVSLPVDGPGEVSCGAAWAVDEDGARTMGEAETAVLLADGVPRQSLRRDLLELDRRGGWNRIHLVWIVRRLLGCVMTLDRQGMLSGRLSRIDAWLDVTGALFVVGERHEAGGSPAGLREVMSACLFDVLMLGVAPERPGELPLDGRDPMPDDATGLAQWYCLPFGLREMFHDAFVRARYPALEQWRDALDDYAGKLAGGGYETRLAVQEPVRSEPAGHRATSLNMGDVDPVADRHLRNIETRFGNHTGRVGVLELSTTSVKLLVGPDDYRPPFSFDMFRRYSRRPLPVSPGGLIGRGGEMDEEGFRRDVLPLIKQCASLARGDWPEPWGKAIPGRGMVEDWRPRMAVDRLYAVATAAYRTAANRDRIIKMIEDEAGIHVRILTRDEEAAATVTAFARSAPPASRLPLGAGGVVFIDQGGGSTEISVHKSLQSSLCGKSYSLDLGVNSLKNLLRRERAPLRQALDSVDGMTERQMRVFLDALPTPCGDRPCCVAVGSAVTSATGVRGSQLLHGMVLTARQLREKIDETERFLLDKGGRTVSHLFSRYVDMTERHAPEAGKRCEQVNQAVVMRLGLPVYLSVMEHFGIDRLTVSGTGLWYGIYFDHVGGGRDVSDQINP